MRVTHNYAGPRGESWFGGQATRWTAICTCGWRGIARVSRVRCKDDHRGHVERERAELRQEIEWDRGAGVDW